MDSASDLSLSQKHPAGVSSPILHPPSDRKVYQGVIQPVGFPGLPSDWTSECETFVGADGALQLFSVTHHYKEWKEPRVLVVLHGLGEHGGRYLHFPNYVRTQVDAVYCMDHRGHGRSEGSRGYVEKFDTYVDDVIMALNRLHHQLKKKFGYSEIHLLGHSMGGLIGLRALLKEPHLPLCSASISAPVLGIRVPIPFLKKYAARTLSYVWGSLQMSSGLDPQQLSRDPAVVEAYQSDRLVHDKVTPSFFIQIQEAMEETRKKQSGIHCPLQMLVPLEDQIVDPDAALHFFRNLKFRDKTLKTYAGFRHEPFNEVGKEQVFADLNAWMKAHPHTR